VTTTWSELEAGLAEVLGGLPEGAVLQLSEAALPEDGGYYAQLWQDADRLHAEISGTDAVRADRRPTAQAEARIEALGWRAPHPGANWSATLDWPAPAIGYRSLAARLVAVLSDVFGIGTPDDLGYQCWLADTGRPLPQPRLGLDPIDVAYYVRRPGPDRPQELLRRIRVGWRITDTALDRAGSWVPTDKLDLAELGELGEDLVRIGHAEATRIAARWTGDAPPLRRTGDEPPLRWTGTARDTDGRPRLAGQPLDGDERAAVAGYLRGAPIVIATFGFDEDPLDPGRAPVVPLSIRTDGIWVWSESDGYFAQRYGIAPEPEFLADIRRRGYRWPEVDHDTLLRAARLVDERAAGRG
jgi:T3SS (YopN, CesT) and YbjN peptide-binding chaperone 3